MGRTESIACQWSHLSRTRYVGNAYTIDGVFTDTGHHDPGRNSPFCREGIPSATLKLHSTVSYEQHSSPCSWLTTWPYLTGSPSITSRSTTMSFRSLCFLQTMILLASISGAPAQVFSLVGLHGDIPCDYDNRGLPSS